MSLNLLGVFWLLLVLYSMSKKMSSTIMLTVISTIFQNALFISIGSARVSIFEVSAIMLIFRYCVLVRRTNLFSSKNPKQELIVIFLFFLITIIDGIVYGGYEIKLYSEYLGLYQTGVEIVSINISTFIVLIRFALYWIIYDIITDYVSCSDYKINDKNAIKTLKVSIYIVCIVGIFQILTSRGYIDGSFVMSIIHDKNMGAASAYYSNYIRLFSTFAEPSYCAPWMNAAIWALIYCDKYISVTEKRILIIILCMEFVLSLSYSGFLSMAVMILYYIYNNKSKKSFVLSVIILCTLCVLYIATPVGNTISGIIGEKVNSTSGLSRLAYIADCYRVFFETHCMGVGYMKIKSMTLLSGLFAQVGILGTISFVWLIIKKMSRRNITNSQNVTKIFLVAVLIGGEASCSGLAYLAPFWYGLLLFAMTNYVHRDPARYEIGSVKNEL